MHVNRPPVEETICARSGQSCAPMGSEKKSSNRDEKSNVFRNDQGDGTAHERWALNRLTRVNTKIQLFGGLSTVSRSLTEEVSNMEAYQELVELRKLVIEP